MLAIGLIPAASFTAWADAVEGAQASAAASAADATAGTTIATPTSDMTGADPTPSAVNLTTNSEGHAITGSVTGSGEIAVTVDGVTAASLEGVSAGAQVTVTATPADGFYTAQVRMSKTIVGASSTTATVYEALTAGSDGAFAFTMPDEDVSVSADFVSIVWDGTMDVTWYNTTDTSFNIYYAAQYAGLAAIVNGIFNNYPTSPNDDGIQIADRWLYAKQMGVVYDDDGAVAGNNLYGEFTATNTIFDTQGQTASSLLDVGIATEVTSTQRVVGNAEFVWASIGNGTQREGSQNLVSTQSYFYGIDAFHNKTVNIRADLDFGGVKRENGTWDTSSSPLFMPIGGQFIMLPRVILNSDGTINCSNGYNHIGSSWCGTLDGHGHKIWNVYCERYGYGTNFGDSQSVGLVGRLGIHDNDYLGQNVTPPVNPTVRCIELMSGYLSTRRGVGGIVGKIGHTSATDLGDGSTGGIIEYCINHADTFNTDAKGNGGICGASWNNGVIRYCATFGTVKSTYADPEGGIVGYNENSIINCYSDSTVLNTNHQSDRFAMGICSDNGGTYVITNCYWRLGKAANDYLTASYWYGGYYNKVNAKQGEWDSGKTRFNGTYSFGDATITTGYYDSNNNFVTDENSVTYSANYPTLTADLLNADGPEIWFDNDDPDVNNGLPILYYQQEGYAETDLPVTVTQPSEGGTISVSQTAAPYGTEIEVTATPDAGWALTTIYVNGKEIDGTTFIVTGDTTVTGTFKQLKSYTFEITDSGDELVQLGAVKTGVVVEDGIAKQVTGVPVNSGDTVYEGDVITPVVTFLEGAAPTNEALEYTGGYTMEIDYALSGVAKTKTLNKGVAYTVGGTEDGDVALTLSIKTLTTQLKNWNTLADTSWYDASATDFELDEPAELAGVTVLLNAGVTFEGQTITLGDDLDMGSDPISEDVTRYWISASKDAYAFKGTFDGGGHTIKGLTTSSEAKSLTGSLFRTATNATIKNVNVELSAAGTYAVMGLVGVATNCTFSSVSVVADISSTAKTATSTGVVIGGIAGKAEACTLLHCATTGSISSTSQAGTSATSGVGGVVGYDLSSTLTGCENRASVTVAGTSAGCYVGGICGSAHATVGSHETSGSPKFAECANYGTVTLASTKASQTYAGGISGYAVPGVEFTSCMNAGDVIATTSTASGIGAGGIFGYANQGVCYDSIVLTNCSNMGAVSASSSNTAGNVYAGGLAARINNFGYTFTDSYTTGAISAEGGAAATVGQMLTSRAANSGKSYDYVVNGCYYLNGATTSAYDESATAILRQGDVNLNGRTNIVDAQVALDLGNGRFEGSSVITLQMRLEADMNNDNVVDAIDARAIQAVVHGETAA